MEKSKQVRKLVTGAMLTQLMVLKLDKAMQSEGIYTNILHQAIEDLGNTVKALETLEAMAAKAEAEAAKSAPEPAPAPEENPVTVN